MWGHNGKVCVCVCVCVLRNRRRTNSVVTRSTKPRETACQQITAAEGNSASRTLQCRHRKEETLRETVFIDVCFLTCFFTPPVCFRSRRRSTAAPQKRRRRRRRRVSDSEQRSARLLSPSPYEPNMIIPDNDIIGQFMLHFIRITICNKRDQSKTNHWIKADELQQQMSHRVSTSSLKSLISVLELKLHSAHSTSSNTPVKVLSYISSVRL